MSDWLQFKDDTHTPEKIAAEINTRLATRQANPVPDIPAYGTMSIMPKLTDHDTQQLAHHLSQANQLYTSFTTDPNLADSAATRIPLLGPLWKRIRGEAHNLILFYVNRSMAEQNQLNTHLIGTLNELARQNVALQQQVQQLQAQIDMQKQVASQ